MKRQGLPPTGDDYMFALFVGVFASFVWPAAVAFTFVYQNAGDGTAVKLLYTPKKHKMEMLQQRIKELEREVGIK